MKFKVAIASLLILMFFSCEQITKVGNARSSVSESQDTTINGVYFTNLRDGDTLNSPVIIHMGVRGMKVEPAGQLNTGKGHHHLIIDGSFVEKGQTIIKDETHLHFGKGQTTDTLKLNPGPHTLTLQFADGMHQSYGLDWSYTVQIFVIK